MPKIALKGDPATNHGPFHPSPSVPQPPLPTSPVLINGQVPLLEGDPILPLVAPNTPPHPRAVKKGSPTVTINGIPVARLDDPVDCGGKIMSVSSNVTIDEG